MQSNYRQNVETNKLVLYGCFNLIIRSLFQFSVKSLFFHKTKNNKFLFVVYFLIMHAPGVCGDQTGDGDEDIIVFWLKLPPMNLDKLV